MYNINDEYSQFESTVECGQCVLLKMENKRYRKAIKTTIEQLKIMTKKAGFNPHNIEIKQLLWDLEKAIS